MSSFVGPARTLQRLEWLILRRLDGLLTGEHEAVERGVGSEAGDARAYEPGDDVRRIDWSLTARSNRTHVRDTVADRELETWLVVDASASLDFGTAGCEKRDLATAAGFAFGYLTGRSGNRLGALVAGADVQVVPPRTGREPAMAMLHRLDTRPRAGEGAVPLAEVLDRANRLARRRGLVVVISDFLDSSPWWEPLRVLGARHDVVAVQVSDPRDRELPPVGVVTFVDPETGVRREVQTSSSVRDRFAEAAARQRDDIVARVAGAGASHVELSTDRDWLADIVHFAGRRRRRR